MPRRPSWPRRHPVLTGLLASIGGLALLSVAGIVALALFVSDAVDPKDPKAVTVADSGTELGEQAPREDGIYGFGDTIEFEDGSKLTVSKPERFSPGEFSGTGKAAHVRVKVRFTNGSAKVFDPAATTVNASSGDTEGEDVFQEDMLPPSNKLLPGKSVTWWAGFGVDDAKNVTVTVGVGFLAFDDVIFTNEQ